MRFPSGRWRAALRRGRRRLAAGDGLPFIVLAGAAVVAGLLAASAPLWAPPGATFVLVLLLGGFLLSMQSLVLLLVVVLAVLLWEIDRLGLPAVRPGNVVVVALTGVLVLVIASRRAAVGVQGLRGESMLVDLRDRLKAQGELPALPAGWAAETVLRPAGGASFSGDFVVASGAEGSDLLELALVDVSGKGVEAGTRALLLSGAFGGLLGAMPPERFLDAANDYLQRQAWTDEFATCVHVAVDLASGDFVTGSAGHPPGAQFHAGSGRWQLLDTEGPALGVLSKPGYVYESGHLSPGDALLLYTDGLVERPGRDIELGIDRLLGEAERLVSSGGFRRGARRLVEATRTGESDDRALVLLWRR